MMGHSFVYVQMTFLSNADFHHNYVFRLGIGCALYLHDINTWLGLLLKDTFKV